MTKTTVSFTIEEEQLERVDAMASRMDRDRSSTLRLLIDAGMLTVEAPVQVVLTDRAVLPDYKQISEYAERVAAALRRGPVPVLDAVCADADRVA